jgi:hypothetical protein
MALYTDISVTANKHFDTFIKSSYPSRANITTNISASLPSQSILRTVSNTQTEPSTNLSQPAFIYAQVVATNTPARNQPAARKP